jgi:formate-dependent nitrite reductase membrane component NrfD
MANAFFSAETGAGLFFVSLLLGFLPGMVAGLLICGIFKSYFHLAHMGVPAKSWRAMLRPDRSWISRGVISIVFFMGFGIVHTANMGLGLEATIGFGPVVSGLIKVIAGAAALMVMTYQGFAMSHSTAIALWNTGIMPITSLAYATTSGLFIALAAGWNGFFGDAPEMRRVLVFVALGGLAVIAALLLSLLHAAHHGSPGGRKSVELLTRTNYAKWFYGATCAAGIVVPAVLLLLPAGFGSVVTAAAAMLIGFYAFRVLIFKAGVYEPIMNFKP